VLPGTYQVQLTVDGQSQTHAFELLPDPRIATSTTDLQAQHDLLLAVRDSLSQANELINQIDGLLTQLAVWRARTDNTAVQDAANAVEDEARAIRGRLIDVNMKQSQLWPSGLHEKFNALLDSVDGTDYAPPQQARAVYAELCDQLDELSSRLRMINETEVAKLNEAIKATGLPLVGLPTNIQPWVE
jgi:hypothetical protein